MVWEVVKTKIDFLKEKLSGQFLLSGMLKSIISKFYSAAKVAEVEEFFQKNPVPNATMAIKQGALKFQIKRLQNLIIKKSYLKKHIYFRPGKCSHQGAVAGARRRGPEAIFI